MKNLKVTPRFAPFTRIEIGKKLAADRDLAFLVEFHIAESAKFKVRLCFLSSKQLNLNGARKQILDLVEGYRKCMAADNSVIQYYKENRPNYNLQRELFPIEDTGIDLTFGTTEETYSEPYIANVLFDEGTIIYFTHKSDTQNLKTTFQETFEEAKSHYSSQGQRMKILLDK